MKTATLENIVIAYRVLLTAKNSKMKDGDKYNMLRIRRELKKHAVEYEDYLKDVRESLKPEGFEKIEGKETLTPEEREIAKNYDRKVDECVSEMLKKEIELDFTPLSEEGFTGLMNSNDFTFGELGVLDDLIG